MIRLRKRAAFRRIEAVIVVAIIVTLIGLTLPSIQRAREDDARAKCQNHLKQIGLAAHNYASACTYLPPGWLGPSPNTIKEATPDGEMQAVGSLCLMIPYLEASTLYGRLVAAAQIDLGAANYFAVNLAYGPWYHFNNLSQIVETQPPVFLCPSDAAPTRKSGCILWQWGPIDQDGVPQNFYIDRDASHTKWGRTNYTGIGGLDQNYYQNAESEPGLIWKKFTGIMGNRSKLSLEQITEADGTANTLMFGEILGDSDGSAGDQLGYSLSWMCGAYPTYSGLPTGDEPYPKGGARCYWAFGSRHNGVVQFCMGDGSVHSIKKGVPPFDTENYKVNLNPKCMFGCYAGWMDNCPLDRSFLGD